MAFSFAQFGRKFSQCKGWIFHFFRPHFYPIINRKHHQRNQNRSYFPIIKFWFFNCWKFTIEFPQKSTFMPRRKLKFFSEFLLVVFKYFLPITFHHHFNLKA